MLSFSCFAYVLLHCFCTLLLHHKMAQASNMKSTANNFSLRLYHFLRSQPGFDSEQNLFYSPASVLVALAMTHLGARGNTAKQMADSFFLNEIPEQQMKQEFHKFLQSLAQSNSNGNELAMANRLFAQAGFEILKEFQEDSAKFFDAQIALVDYETNAEGARGEVNKWVELQTREKIKDLIPEGMFNTATRLALVNAIYFKGSWMSKFDPNNTQPGQFNVTTSKNIEVPMMYQSDDFKYIKDSDLNCQVLDLPYSGDKMSMIILLPDEVDGLSKLEESLSYEKLDKMITRLKKRRKEEVEVTIPKFKLAEKFSMKSVLGRMGAGDMFNPSKADFAGISSSGQLFVSEVVHKAFVDVNEEGTEAAAATGIGIALMSMPMNPIFLADHPFLFLIHHNETGVVLFLGRMAKPEQ